MVVSIDSDDASQHDDVRKVEGLYQKAIDGIEKLKLIRKGQKPRIKSTTVVFRANLERLEQIIGRLELIVDETSIQPIVGDYEDHPHNRGEQRLAKFLFESDDMQVVAKNSRSLFQTISLLQEILFPDDSNLLE